LARLVADAESKKVLDLRAQLVTLQDEINSGAKDRIKELSQNYTLLHQTNESAKTEAAAKHSADFQRQKELYESFQIDRDVRTRDREGAERARASAREEAEAVRRHQEHREHQDKESRHQMAGLISSGQGPNGVAMPLETQVRVRVCLFSLFSPSSLYVCLSVC
jgi:hypothetical protein